MSTDNLIIRPATLDDAPAIQAIYAPYCEKSAVTFELSPPDVDEMRERISAVLDAGYPYFVIEERGEILGYAYAGPYKARAAYRFAVEDSIYLKESATGRGIGSKLLGYLIDHCEQRGFRQMLGIITYFEDAPSIALHEKFGFVKDGLMKSVGWKNDQWYDVLFMRKELGKGASCPPDVEPLE